MTVSSDVNRISYAGNGSTTVFPVNYYFLENSHLQVILITSAGVETIQTLTTNYTVTGAGNEAGGSVTMLVAPPVNVTIVIQRSVPATQETDYLANDPFPAESHERALDKLTMLAQQNEREIDRALKIPLASVATTSTELPIPVGNKLLAWNSNASAITNFDPAAIISIVGQQTSYGDVFTGNGSTVNFTLSRSPGSVFNLDVSVNGVTQVPNVDYTLGGTTLTFTSAPPAVASKILARYSEVYEEVDADAQNVRYLPAGVGAQLTNVQAKLRQTVSVKDFGATATASPATNAAAITAAIDYSLSFNPHLTVLFPEVVDITGYTITITKAPDYGDRQYLKLFGIGGGIKKTDAGFIFQGYAPLVGDISVMCMSFVSNNNAGTIVWDCNTILRIYSSHNEYLNIDTVTKQDSLVTMQLMQSCRFTNEKITGGRGAAFLWQRASDCTFSNLLVENRETCFENILDTGLDVNMNQNFNVRITDCVIEGNVYGNAHAIKWGNSWACTIARNYFESNKTDIDLDTLVRASHKGLTFMGNVFFLSSAQKLAGYKPVKVGNLWTVIAANYRSHTNFFAGNVSDGELYDFVGTGTLNSFGDYSFQFTGWNNPRIATFSGSNLATTTGGNSLKTSGVTRKISFTQTETNVLAGEIRTVAIALSDADISNLVSETTIYTVYPRQINSISVLGINPVFATATSGTLNIVIQNRTLSTVASAVLAINVLLHHLV